MSFQTVKAGRNARLLGKIAVGFRLIDVVQHIDDTGAANRVGIVTPASLKPDTSRSWVARFSAMNFMSSLVPKCRQPVGQDLMQAGSRPAPTLSEHSVHL